MGPPEWAEIFLAPPFFQEKALEQGLMMGRGGMMYAGGCWPGPQGMMEAPVPNGKRLDKQESETPRTQSTFGENDGFTNGENAVASSSCPEGFDASGFSVAGGGCNGTAPDGY